MGKKPEENKPDKRRFPEKPVDNGLRQITPIFGPDGVTIIGYAVWGGGSEDYRGGNIFKYS